MKLLVDMSLSPQWVSYFEGHGIEAVHWSAIGAASAPDREILEFAAEQGYIIFTNDLDFGTLLHACRARRPSVFQVRTQDVLPSAIGADVLQAIQSVRMYLDQGALVTLDMGRRRLRLLPL
jgi:predicted nuclease of predicted toxin-antitoxin system